jgi:Fe2+ transport system protein FeoA
MICLNDLKRDQSGKVCAIVGYESTMLLRMNSLGIRLNSKIEILRNWWFMPLHVRIGMTEFFIRKSDAKNIWVNGVN